MTQKTSLQFQPDKTAFLGMRLISTVVGTIVASAVAIWLTITMSPWIALGLVFIVLMVVYDVFDALAAYRKQRYQLEGSTAYYNTGSLFSDRNTELSFGNITHVRVKKPFIEYHLFGTGTIIIESAGSKDATVEMRALKQPYEAFQAIRGRLAETTFSLTYKELLSEKKPSPLAVMLGLVGSIIVAGGFIVFNIGLGTIVSLATDSMFGLVVGVGIGLVMAGCIYLYAIYQDQLRRTYYVYSDVIHYSKGFLTRQEAFMPAGNLANTRLTQNFFGKLLNLQDVVISCQGQGSEINFANLRDGEVMQQAINDLINNRQSLKSAEPAESAKPASVSTTDKVKAQFTAEPTPAGEDVSAQDFRMDLKRALMPLLPMVIVPPLFAVALIAQLVVVKRTVFRLTAGGVASYYTFLSTKNVEFSRDKITGLVIKRNFLDRYFDTCTVSFWSIGSGAEINFKHIAYNQDLEDLMRAKAGIVDDEELDIIKPQFSLPGLFKAQLWEMIAIGLLLVAIIVAAAVWSWWILTPGLVLLAVFAVVFIILQRRYARAFLRLGQHTTMLDLGVIFNKKYFARHDNVKDLTLTKYPLSSSGEVQFNVAGERIDTSSQNGASRIPNSFKLAYIADVAADVRGQRSWLDQLLLQKPDRQAYAQITQQAPAPAKIRQSRPVLKNSLAKTIPLHIVLFPLLIILPISIWASWYWLRRVEYRLENDRVVKRWGVIYRKQHSVLLQRLDYTETGQKLFNKIFKNGNLYFYTTGSSKAELTLENMSDYQEFYQELKASS